MKPRPRRAVRILLLASAWAAAGLVVSVLAALTLGATANLSSARVVRHGSILAPSGDIAKLLNVVEARGFGYVRRYWECDRPRGLENWLNLFMEHLSAKGMPSYTTDRNRPWDEIAAWGRLREFGPDPWGKAHKYLNISEHAAGWPMLSFWCEIPDPSQDWRAEIEQFGGVRLQQSGIVENEVTMRVIPLRPIRTGIVANAICFSVGGFVLWNLPGVVRRRFKRRRGGCPRCGYDLSGIAAPVCPECGCQR